MKKSVSIGIIIAAVLAILGFILDSETFSIILYIAAYLIVGFDVIKNAIQNLFKGEIFDENFLMVVATIGALCIHEYPEAIAVMLLYRIGEMFQDAAVDKSRDAIKKLMEIRPDVATIKSENGLIVERPEKVNIGDIIVVKPGEKVPLDGIVLEGNSTLDTKTVTGESIPKNISKDETIYSGCINLTSVLEIKVTKDFKESTVSKILQLVEDATAKKAKTEKFITKFAKIYTPVVCLLAMLIALVPTIVFEQSFTQWIYRALTFLVISCPCALVISVPLGFFAGLGGASRKGILIKGSNYLENLTKANSIVFDKTGTITKGTFEIQKIVPNNISEKELLKIVAHGEMYSNHPLAVSIKEKYDEGYDEKQVENIEEIAGKGVKAKIFGEDTLIGNAKLMGENNISFDEVNEIGTIIYVAVKNEYKGYILISDTIKDNVKKAINKMKKLNIKETYMFTGDDEKIANQIAKEVGIDICKAKLLPDQKLKKLESLIKKNKKVIFVGDGINDSPCLARADVGIAMGGVGADAAIEAADVVIMNDDLSKIGEAIEISRKTIKIVKQNIVFAIFIKLLILCLGVLGIADMWMAVFADVGVSMIAIINSMRALKS